jgi:hypothetical protein
MHTTLFFLFSKSALKANSKEMYLVSQFSQMRSINLYSLNIRDDFEASPVNFGIGHGGIGQKFHLYHLLNLLIKCRTN